MDTMNFRKFLTETENHVFDWQVANLYYGSPELGVKEISEKTGKSIAEIYRIIERMGGRPNRQVTNHHNVHMFADAGVPLRQIANLTGYTERNVRIILKGR